MDSFICVIHRLRIQLKPPIVEIEGPVPNTSTADNYPRFLLIDEKLDGEDEGSDDDDDDDDDDDGGLQSQVRSRFLKHRHF